MKELARPTALEPGRRLGPFVLEQRVAMGGMAEIWSARSTDGRTESRLALKILQARYGNEPMFRTMFLDEVKIARLLHHENILRVFGVDDFEGHLFQSMELIDGKDLRFLLLRCVRSGQRPKVVLTLFIARAVLRALAYAHNRQSPQGTNLEIVHRDVSPHNVMVDRDGRVLLLDFGIARAVDRLSRTATGVIKGKLAYMSPEQVTLQDVTAKADVFAAGVVLFELLTTQRLFVGETDAETVDKISRAEVPPIPAINPEVSDDVWLFVRSMLALEPDDRPSSTEALAQIETLCRALSEHPDSEAHDRMALGRWVEAHLGPRREGTVELPLESVLEARAVTDSDVNTQQPEHLQQPQHPLPVQHPQPPPSVQASPSLQDAQQVDDVQDALFPLLASSPTLQMSPLDLESVRELLEKERASSSSGTSRSEQAVSRSSELPIETESAKAAPVPVPAPGPAPAPASMLPKSGPRLDAVPLPPLAQEEAQARALGLELPSKSRHPVLVPIPTSSQIVHAIQETRTVQMDLHMTIPGSLVRPNRQPAAPEIAEMGPASAAPGSEGADTVRPPNFTPPTSPAGARTGRAWTTIPSSTASPSYDPPTVAVEQRVATHKWPPEARRMVVQRDSSTKMWLLFWVLIALTALVVLTLYFRN